MTEHTDPKLTFAGDAWESLIDILVSWKGLTVRLTTEDGQVVGPFTIDGLSVVDEDDATGWWTIEGRRFPDEFTHPADDAPRETFRVDKLSEIHLY